MCVIYSVSRKGKGGLLGRGSRPRMWPVGTRRSQAYWVITSPFNACKLYQYYLYIQSHG